MVRLQKLYSKFKAIESGRAVTEVTKGSCCGRRDRWRQLSAIRGTETCSTRLKVFFRLRPVPVAHTQRRGPWPRQARVLTGGRWISRTIPARVGEGRQRRCLGNVSRPTTAYRTFSPDRGRFFSVRRPVYGESRSGFVWLLPLLPPRHGRLLH